MCPEEPTTPALSVTKENHHQLFRTIEEQSSLALICCVLFHHIFPAAGSNFPSFYISLPLVVEVVVR